MKFLVFSLATLLVSAALGSAQEAAFDVKASAERGKPLYLQTCIACHQPTGMGLPGAFPPLGGAEYTNGSARRMVAMMLKGMTAEVLLLRCARVGRGDTVLFHAAAGGVGSIACQWAKQLGIRVIGTAGGPAKVERAKRVLDNLKKKWPKAG